MNRRTALLAGASGVVAAIGIESIGQAAEPVNPELEKVKALLKTHDEAMTKHDLEGVLKCLTEKPALMGTGPGEMWVGPEEVKDAYNHFFAGYDKGQQDFEYHFRVGDLRADMGWLMASGNVKGKKEGKDFTYPLNVSATVAKAGGDWRIASMHFSTLTGSPGAVTSNPAS
jgi:ketosteroid isomerase-like protein